MSAPFLCRIHIDDHTRISVILNFQNIFNLTLQYMLLSDEVGLASGYLDQYTKEELISDF
jgi:hypothetical protein